MYQTLITETYSFCENVGNLQDIVAWFMVSVTICYYIIYVYLIYLSFILFLKLPLPVYAFKLSKFPNVIHQTNYISPRCFHELIC